MTVIVPGLAIVVATLAVQATAVGRGNAGRRDSSNYRCKKYGQ